MMADVNRLVLIVVGAGLAGCSFQSFSAGEDARPVADAFRLDDGAIVPPIDAPPPPVDAPPLPVDAFVSLPRLCSEDFVTIPGAPANSRYRLYETGIDPASGEVGLSGMTTVCESQNAYVWIPNTAAEALAVVTAFPPSTKDGYSAYIRVGVSRISRSAPWIDVMGLPFVPNPWGPSQPSDGSLDLGLLLRRDAKYFDYFVDSPDSTACECDENPLVP